MTPSLQTIKINLFGIGCRVIKGEFDEGIWKKFESSTKVMRCPMDEAFFDEAFYNLINIEEYKSILDLGNIYILSGLMNSTKSLIEIRINNRKRRNIPFIELLNESVLFPVFQTTICKVDELPLIPNSLIAIEKEMGTIASYKFETESFSLDKLSFTLTDISIRKPSDYILLSKIEYEGEELIGRQSDTVVTERFCLVY